MHSLSQNLTSSYVSFIITVDVEKLSKNIPLLTFKNNHLISDLNFWMPGYVCLFLWTVIKFCMCT